MNHENTRIYVRALELVKLAESVASDLPRGHAPLADQLRRASSGIALTFAEGYEKGTLKEQRRYFRMAKGSAHEVGAIFDIALILGGVTPANHSHGKDLCDHLVRMLALFRR